MDFDIYGLDNVDVESDEALKLAEEYEKALLEKFEDSPEGLELQESDPETQVRFWAERLIDFGFSYLGTTIPQMTVEDVEEIAFEIMPRKISLISQDDLPGAAWTTLLRVMIPRSL